MGSVVDGSGSVVRLLVGPGSVVVTGGSIGAITMAVVVTSVVGMTGGSIAGVSLGAGRWAIDGVLMTSVVVGVMGSFESAGTTRNAAGAPRTAAPPTPRRTRAAPRPTRPLRRMDLALDVVFPGAAAAWFAGTSPSKSRGGHQDSSSPGPAALAPCSGATARSRVR